MDGLSLTSIDYGDQHKLHDQALFLYDLLKERDPSANISHKEVPPFFQHLAFINSRPYAVWDLIELDGKPIGSVYLTADDEIGIFLSKENHYKGLGRKALLLFMSQNPRTKYLANISPKNHFSQQFFHGLGFKCIQFTYQLETECAA